MSAPLQPPLSGTPLGAGIMKQKKKDARKKKLIEKHQEEEAKVESWLSKYDKAEDGKFSKEEFRRTC